MAAIATAPTTATVLRDAADLLAALPHARVNTVDLHRALRQAAHAVHSVAQAALDVLAAYLTATGDEQWLCRWSVPRGRDMAAAELRAAADAVTPMQGMGLLQYPSPGSEIPGQPGFVVATCGHRVAGSEWRAGFRTCERCPTQPGAVGGR